MNPQETQQVVAYDEKWVPSIERVKICSTNVRLETTVPQKEETFQVVIDIIKNSTCFKAFTIFVDVLEIFMKQFWYTIKKVQDTDSYEFLLANKKCIVNPEVFKTFLDICPRVEAIINKCLSGKTTSNDKLKKSRIDILWGMFNRENVDYPELIWKDFAYQIDHKKEKRSRRENMLYPLFTKIIINYFLKQYKSLTNLNHKHYHTIKDDGIISRLKFVRIGEDYQEYGLLIPDVMLTDAIKCSESYQMFIKYLTNQIPPKKIKGRGSKDVALELAKSIRQTKAEEAVRKVHATHARIMTEYVSESAKKKSSGRSSKSVVIQDTPSTLKSKPATLKTKLKGASSLTLQEQEAADIIKPGVPDESTGDKQDNEFSDDDNDDVEKDDKDGDVDDEGDDHVSDTQDADDEDVETESDEDEIYKYKIPSSEINQELTPAAKQESDKSPSDILKIKKEQVEKQKKPQFTIKSTDKTVLEEYDLKSTLYQSMHANKSFNRNPTNHRLYHALIEELIEDENAIDKGVANTVKDHKRKHDDDEDDDDED
nr:hypothetical protein [Tanacetum cinerariifolium]